MTAAKVFMGLFSLVYTTDKANSALVMTATKVFMGLFFLVSINR